MDQASIAIRPCLQGELVGVVAVSERWAAEDSTIGQLLIPTDLAHTWLGPYFLVAELAGELVGFAYAAVETSEGLAVIPAGERYLRLEELYVAPEQRDGGIGGHLVDAMLAQAAKDGVTRGRVYSASRDWRRIVAFYERHGFQMWYVELAR